MTNVVGSAARRDAAPVGVRTTPDPRTVLDALVHDAAGYGRLVTTLDLPARPARFAALADPIPEAIETRLRELGIDELYTHQAAAVDALRGGTDVVLATGTASGKSLGYQLPIAASMFEPEPATALLVFPTKALAQDQLRAMRTWLVPNLIAATYDGDTETDERAKVRRAANVILTNPEMLHQAILPFHARWATFFMRLQYVVIDELHTLRGVFGAHVAMILRRLRRLCEHYGSQPTFCFASATIGNPAELATSLLGRPVRAIDDDGAPTEARRLLVWQRPLEDAMTGTRPAANTETARLLAHLVEANVLTIAFARSRRGVEVIASTARAELESHGRGEAASKIAAYRSGYLATERRDLEVALQRGDLLGIAATSALELGIDIGGLDAVIVNGFPGTLASFWQQVGRAGRAHRPAVAVLVAGDDQLDQWYAAHPDDLLTRRPESSIVNADNPYVLVPHTGCAAHELPLTPDDARWFGTNFDDAVLELVRRDLLKPRDGRMYWADAHAPAPRIGLRAAGGGGFELRLATTDELIGTVDAARVWDVAHEGAIYVHQGSTFRVIELDIENHTALLEAADDADEFTMTRSRTDITIESEIDQRPLGAGAVHLGTVLVLQQTTAYQRRRLSTRSVIETVPLDAPATELTTTACWFTVPIDLLPGTGIDASRVLGAVHAAEHALIGMLPRFAICDRWDVGGVSMAVHPQTGEPTIVIYDGTPGGSGIAPLGFAAAADHVAAAAELVAACPCTAGCPSCVQSPKCGNWNEYLDKDAAVVLLEQLARDQPPRRI